MPPYVYFFTGQSPFSNFYRSPFKWRGIEFSCNEQFYMYMKAQYFKDEDSCKKILEAKEPRVHKMLGRRVKNFNKEQWKTVCRSVMKVGLVCKVRAWHNYFLIYL